MDFLRKSIILDKVNKSIACDSLAASGRLSDGGTNPPLGVIPIISAGNADTHPNSIISFVMK